MNKIQLEIVKDGFIKTITNSTQKDAFNAQSHYKLTKVLIDGAVTENPPIRMLEQLVGKEVKVYIAGYGNRKTYKLIRFDSTELMLELVGREPMPPCYMHGEKPVEDLYFEDDYKERPIRYYHDVDEENLSTPVKIVLPDNNWYVFNPETKTINMECLTDWIGYKIIIYKNSYYTGTRIITECGKDENGIQYFSYDKGES